jgi:hypothetical protein
MDTYSGYNQIKMYPPDEDKMAFLTDRGTYCYKVMPFGLKNAGATFQCMVNHVFKDLIGKTMEVYVDDMLVKSSQRMEHIQHLEEAFSLLRKYKIRLNPEKCTFGVASGKFLGYLVTQRGIEANPDQISAILDMKSPTCVKEVQSLTGRLAALNRFLGRSTDQCRPLFQAIKKSESNFQWTSECEEAIQELKS